jgi:hypothetical protein
VAQAVACLLGKLEALSSNPSPTKKKKKKELMDGQKDSSMIKQI